VLEASKRVLGVEHPTTLTAMSNLAYTWKGQGRDSKALELMEECARLRLQVLGNDHPYTNDSLAKLSQWQAEQLDISAADIKK
jgi:Tetratricopeptide repeat